MSVPDPPVYYRVCYSDNVLAELKQLAATAAAEGRGEPFLEAVKEIDRLLSISPQFGEPLRDLHLLGTQTWIAIRPPLVVEYAVDEELRTVWVLKPLRLL